MRDRTSTRPSGRTATLVGLLIIFLFFGVFGVWAAVAPLSTAAIAVGEVTVESKRKTVQHLEGGIVSEILVKDGDVVEAGQVLIRLDQVQPSAALALQESRMLAARTLEARLIAERDGLDFVVFPADLMARRNEPAIRTLMDGQRRIFETRRRSLLSQIAILGKRTAQVREEIRGLDAQIKSDADRLRLIGEEEAAVAALVKKGLMPRPRLLALQRQAAEIQGSRGRNIAAVARARQSIAETELQIEDLKTTRAKEVVKDLRDVQANLFDITERVNAARDVLRRTAIVAPIAGTVVGTKIATPGGVISPGEPLLDIVPTEDLLVVEARVKPEDIDIVHPGLKAQVRFSAFDQRNLAPIEGKVVSVSADRLIDQNTKTSYYLARIVLSGNVRKRLKGASLYPGMQADVMIITGKRTALSYFLRPVKDSFNRAFREQ